MAAASVGRSEDRNGSFTLYRYPPGSSHDSTTALVRGVLNGGVGVCCGSCFGWDHQPVDPMVPAAPWWCTLMLYVDGRSHCFVLKYFENDTPRLLPINRSVACSYRKSVTNRKVLEIFSICPACRLSQSVLN